MAEGRKCKIYENVNSHLLLGHEDDNGIQIYQLEYYNIILFDFFFLLTGQCLLMLYFSVTPKLQLKDKIRMHRSVKFQRLSLQCGMC